MELETINKLYLELSQVATAKTERECKLELDNHIQKIEYGKLMARCADLEDLLSSARAIAQRAGVDTAWARFDARIAERGIDAVRGIFVDTTKTFRVLPSDE